jgi:hypothetical protein
VRYASHFIRCSQLIQAVRCRSLKARCIVVGEPPCRGCRRAKANCIFVPRANAAQHAEFHDHQPTNDPWKTEIEDKIRSLTESNARLENIVAQLLSGRTREQLGHSAGVGSHPDAWGMISAIQSLRKDLPFSLSSHSAWSDSAVSALWSSYVT